MASLGVVSRHGSCLGRRRRAAISKLCSTCGDSTRTPADNSEFIREVSKKWNSDVCENSPEARDRQMIRVRHSRLYQPSADCVAYKTCCLMDIQFLHEPHAMRFGSLHADTQDRSSVLRGFSFSNQLQHLSLAHGQGICWPIGFGPVCLHHCA